MIQEKAPNKYFLNSVKCTTLYLLTFLQFEKGWWGGAHIEIDLDRNRGLELQQACSDDEVGWSAGAGLFGQLAKAITKVELGGAVTYEYNMSKTQADCTMLLKEVMVVVFTFSLSSNYHSGCQVCFK